MSKKDRDYLFYLEDMLDSMERIMEYTDGLTFDEFQESNLITDAVIRNLEIIGEASKNVPEKSILPFHGKKCTAYEIS
ncbi:DUF86 domain-containing protein [Rhodohalobacter sp. WB101]|uniref:DUF86 domain-containing protein n=1 Tax=Rhodohalobacter sulfatireducens TaxID=2911366 RepID=A0ABS9K8M0_9BACT|nr:HepT-like ribonuclease domain-containing protein [Rhodohalobacter sulfatireducens]MCG2587205.1 DUF86 domain-containing protein [Rhodohalobacter sulfatireducens]MDR9365158.1 DUF86 domain-containing protein [Balneolaceae bacterium]MDR9410270.1 DUF86 domain-containing protein [Balneolaceae bacterium]